MHNQLSINRFLDTALLAFSIGFALLFVLSTSVSAASGCNLSFGLQSGASSVASGGTVTRTVMVRNNGPIACKQVSFSLYYSPNETFVSSTPAARAGNYYWVLGQILPGKQTTVSVTTKHNASEAGSSIDTEGCVSASNGADACATSSVAVSGSSSAPVAVPTPVVTPVPSPVPTPVPTPTPSPAPFVPSVASGKELGMWIWEFPKDMLSASADAELKQLQGYGFNTLYITVDDYIDIASMPAGTAKTAAINAYFANLAAFVKRANGYGMQVDAEGGWRD
jgi:uncharacterized repeat protein (TIGR01451 family)